MQNKSKKVYILTLHRSLNYGAVLQCYSLQKQLESIGFSVKVLNYNQTKDKKTIFWLIWNWLKVIRKIYERKIYKRSEIRKRIRSRKEAKVSKKFLKIFTDFRNRFYNLTPIEYGYKELLDSPPNAYAYIVGSDQVWGQDFIFTSPVFLLAFGSTSTKKIAYAPSFGKATMEKYMLKTFQKEVSKFDHISVREKSGVQLLNRLGISGDQVLDPTLVIDKLLINEIMDESSVPKRDYVLIYWLNQEKRLFEWFQNQVEKHVNQVDIVYVSTNVIWERPKHWIENKPTPGQLLALFKNAKQVFTNSFHGTVFSIKYKKDFFVFPRDAHSNKQNLRLIDILNTIGLKDRFLFPYSNASEVILSVQQINYESVEQLLQKHIKKSQQFLQNSLK